MIRNLVRKYSNIPKFNYEITDIKNQCYKILKEECTHTPGRVKIINSIINKPEIYIQDYRKFDKDMSTYLEYLYIINSKCS